MEQESFLYKALVEEINMILNEYDDYKDISLNGEIISNIAWDIINYEDHLWEELNNTICDYIRKELVKDYINKKESDKSGE